MSWDGYTGQIFPSDMLHHQDTLEAVLHRHPAPLRAPPGSAELMTRDAAAPVVDGSGAVVHGAAPRRRAFRTDRHSKIRTAQGVRDRRMRLSVGVAREFFALQDRLGFDKASKTVNWLLTQSKPAIDRLNVVDSGGDPASVPPAAMPKGMRGGEGSSSSTFQWEKAGRSRGGGREGPAAALVEEHGGDLDWITSHAGAAAVPPQPMDELEYCYQYYLQLAGGPR
ncbi:hypothetical protein HU200_005282 [Digitaria exilis]|uniref:TCP domain-containing protein n=1 Tax=Digitaria exilis TaxID=1010633 RepID=A0A835FTE5_9POAL|nr:hypothetical protein HU200_005282 [Digitaria exilis]